MYAEFEINQENCVVFSSPYIYDTSSLTFYDGYKLSSINKKIIIIFISQQHTFPRFLFVKIDETKTCNVFGEILFL